MKIESWVVFIILFKFNPSSYTLSVLSWGRLARENIIYSIIMDILK